MTTDSLTKMKSVSHQSHSVVSSPEGSHANHSTVPQRFPSGHHRPRQAPTVQARCTSVLPASRSLNNLTHSHVKGMVGPIKNHLFRVQSQMPSSSPSHNLPHLPTGGASMRNTAIMGGSSHRDGLQLPSNGDYPRHQRIGWNQTESSQLHRVRIPASASLRGENLSTKASDAEVANLLRVFSVRLQPSKKDWDGFANENSNTTAANLLKNFGAMGSDEDEEAVVGAYFAGVERFAGQALP